MQRNKIVLVGTTHTGKTSIIQRYITGKFQPNTLTSMQAAFFQKKIALKSSEETLEIWDTAGQEKYRSLAPMYYRDAKAAIVVFDVTDANSFSKAKQWINELKTARGDNIIIVLVGNKADLQFIRVVQTAEAKQYANSCHFSYFETSAKTGVNVEQLFLTVAEQLVEKQANEFDVTSINPPLTEKDKDSPCC